MVKREPSHPETHVNFNHTAHNLVLDTSLDIYVHDHDNLRTKPTKENIAEARERSQVPMNRADYARREHIPSDHESPRTPGTPPRQTNHIERTQQ